ncbi:putative SUMO-activating enzyme subunit 2-like [Apostichopus japonicus]|uniref:SUMO-activating enzyme subunit n=1 Tax=Stichopus japonicus TaxID=307972 RepID=A0A2G8KQ24_STIJA|nr:putative SUMO-activating enzyme subunit 2-like [Apostichopus japonicus]
MQYCFQTMGRIRRNVGSFKKKFRYFFKERYSFKMCFVISCIVLVVAKESCIRFNPYVKIDAKHDSITNPEYNRDFFMQFDVVMNALDNRAARNHVNRMCLAADVPLVESGSAGYLGQVTVIKKSKFECYECQPSPREKTFPGCTIRNTPSEPIHCIVWAKHLFNQLFGEEDPDQDVSPDTADPEAAGDSGRLAVDTEAKSSGAGGIERVSTREWAEASDHDPQKLFKKLFHDDIQYLLSMDKLWVKRRPPVPLIWEQLPKEDILTTRRGSLEAQRLWTVQECANVFSDSLKDLKEQYKQRGELAWDKDDKAAMDFVTCTANLRSHIFLIPQKSRFDVKSMAGNIIPAIATTNAVIAGLIVVEALKILAGSFNKCKTVYMSRFANARRKLLIPCELVSPNPKCYVCSPKPEVSVKLNTNTLTIKSLEDKIFKACLGMIAPDVEIDDGKGSIIISSEAGETEGNNNKTLSSFAISGGSRLKADDFLQNYELIINIVQCENLAEEKEFEIVGTIPEASDSKETPGAITNNGTAVNGGAEDQAGPSMVSVQEDDEDELIMMESEDEDEDDEALSSSNRKRPLTEETHQAIFKKARLSETDDDTKDDNLVVLES